MFGGKYVSLTTPTNPSPQRITPQNVIDARSVTTEINTLFQTITSISEKVDPVKLNLTLSAAAQSLTGLGDKFGQSIVNGNAILDDVNPQMPQIRHDIQQLAGLGDTYANAAPDLFDFLNNAVTTSRTFNAAAKGSGLRVVVGGRVRQHRRGHLRARRPVSGAWRRRSGALGPAAGHLQPGDLLHPAQLPRHRTQSARTFLGGNGYSLNAHTRRCPGLGLIANPLSLAAVGLLTMGLGGVAGLVGGAPNPYTYPENLPRINAHGGPGGAPGLLAAHHP